MPLQQEQNGWKDETIIYNVLCEIIVPSSPPKPRVHVLKRSVGFMNQKRKGRQPICEGTSLQVGLAYVASTGRLWHALNM